VWIKDIKDIPWPFRRPSACPSVRPRVFRPVICKLRRRSYRSCSLLFLPSARPLGHTPPSLARAPTPRTFPRETKRRHRFRKFDRRAFEAYEPRSARSNDARSTISETDGGGGGEGGGGRVSRSGMSRYAIPAVFTCALCLCRACVLYLCSHRELSLDLAVLSCAAFTRRSSVTSNRFPPRPFSRCSVPGGTSSSSVRSLVRQYRGKNGRRLGESKLLRALNACRARLDGSLIARNLKRTSLAASRRKCSSAIYSATTRLVPLDSASFEDIEIP